MHTTLWKILTTLCQIRKNTDTKKCCVIQFLQNSGKFKLIYNDRNQVDSHLQIEGVGRTQENFWEDGNVLYLNFGTHFISVYVYLPKLIKFYTLSESSVFYVIYTSMKIVLNSLWKPWIG